MPRWHQKFHQRRILHWTWPIHPKFATGQAPSSFRSRLDPGQWMALLQWMMRLHTWSSKCLVSQLDHLQPKIQLHLHTLCSSEDQPWQMVLPGGSHGPVQPRFLGEVGWLLSCRRADLTGTMQSVGLMWWESQGFQWRDRHWLVVPLGMLAARFEQGKYLSWFLVSLSKQQRYARHGHQERQAGKKNRICHLFWLNGFDSEASLAGWNSKWSSRYGCGNDKPPC